MSNKTVTVYWANFSVPEAQESMILLNLPPEKLMKDFFKNKAGDDSRTYVRCPATQSFMKNTYFARFPVDLDVTFENGVAHGERSGLFMKRKQDFQDKISTDIDYQWIFFAEESLEVEVLPPFGHKTEASQYGMIAMGGFDIGQWFRPVTANHILWEGETRFKAKEGEPMFYLRFKTNKQVILKPFYVTEKIYKLASSNVGFARYYKEGLSLAQRYERFKITKMRDMVLKEIKANLI